MEANRLAGLVERRRELLNEGLTEAQREKLGQYADCAEDYQLYLMELAFREGFGLGLRLAAEGMCGQGR